jgi:large subunit ribosomal protein L9
MQVILLQNVAAHGLKGAVVEVSEGYARNFLFPAHFAIEASPKALKDKADQENRAVSKATKISKEDRQLASKLDGLEIMITAKSDGGKLYASVGPKDVVAALQELGFKVSDDQVEMTPVKEVGTSTAIINFPSGYEATLSIIIDA